MTKLLACLALVVLVAVAFAEENAGEQPVIYEKLRSKGFGRLLDVGCALRDMLKDRETSDHIYNLYFGVKKSFAEIFSCANERIIPALNDKAQPLGMLVSALRFGNTNNVKSLSEVFQGLGFGTLFAFHQLNQSFDKVKLSDQVSSLTEQIVQECGKQKMEKYREDITFIEAKFNSFHTELE